MNSMVKNRENEEVTFKQTDYYGSYKCLISSDNYLSFYDGESSIAIEFGIVDKDEFTFNSDHIYLLKEVGSELYAYIIRKEDDDFRSVNLYSYFSNLL